MRFDVSGAESLNPSVIDEVNMWTSLLSILSKGLPVPFNPGKMVGKILQEAKRDSSNKEHYDKILACCYQIEQINEVKHYKPIIESILNKIILITSLDVDYIELKNE